ncbi:MAG: type I-B CRISPR-associated protein Cas7/Csh2 [Chlorobi bacterium]|nr:type I-B CRISPR-associated protein Cas7/Csh2 [Chlorobiota bacterium]
MANTIKNKSELLLLYDVTNANPNGDPLDENKPRMDEKTGINLVTDVRLKRFIRDYLHLVKGHEIFVIEKTDEKGNVYDAKKRAKDFDDDPDKILEECIDIRLFGGVIPISIDKKKDSSITFTGPVQFKMGHSLHRVEPVLIQGTGAFASKEGRQQKTFREEWIVPYSFIAFYGIVNQNAAKDTGLTEDDVEELLEGMWEGVKESSITRSKFGHVPRLLMQIVYKEGENFYIGELDKKLELKSDKRDEEIRDVSDFTLDITNLIEDIKKHRDKIDKIRFKVDERLQLEYNGEPTTLPEALKEISIVSELIQV